MIGTEVQIESGGKWTREEETPFAGGSRSREEDTTSNRVSQSRTEGGGYGAAHIDNNNMHFDHLVHNAALGMPAMRFSQTRSVLLTDMLVPDERDINGS
jgi:hypothetical protein